MRRFLPFAVLLLTSCTPATMTPRQRLDVAAPYVRTSVQVACASLDYLSTALTSEELAHARTACEAFRVVVGEVLELARGRVAE